MLDFLIGNDFLSSIVAFGLVLIPAIIIHELGHFLAAKAVGITILEFGIGYPPRIAKLFNWGETEFTLNWIPLGGFVRPLGEDMIRPLSEEETRAEREKLLNQLDGQQEANPQPVSEREELASRGVKNVKAVNDVKPWPRILFMVAGALANIFGAFVIFVVIGLIGVEQPAGARVFLQTVEPDSWLAEAGFLAGDFIETLNGEKFDSSREFFTKLNALAGQEAEITLQRFTVEDRPSEELTIHTLVDEDGVAPLANANAMVIVSSIQANSPADAAGVELEDAIIGIGDIDLRPTVNPFTELQRVNRANEGKAISLRVLRAGEIVELQVTPRVNPGAGMGHLGAGVQTEFVSDEGGAIYGEGPIQVDYLPLPFGEAVTYGLTQIRDIISLIFELPARILRGEAQPEEGRVVSIVGITQLGSEFLQQSIEEDRPIVILNYIALISIALGITNLLPIPPLDGGRILFVLVEIVRGRPMSPQHEGTILLIGIAFLLSIGVYFIINDILNPLTNLLP